MAFDDLTENQKRLIIWLNQVLGGGGYSDEFMAKRTMHSGWHFLFIRLLDKQLEEKQPPSNIDQLSLKTDIQALREEAYITLQQRNQSIPSASLKPKARQQYTKYEQEQVIDMSDDIHLKRLIKVYQATGGSQSKAVSLIDVLKDEALSQAEIDNEAEYMEGENWIKAFGGEGIDFFITHAGIKAAQNHIGSSYGVIKGARISSPTSAHKVKVTIAAVPPVEIQESLELFKTDYPDPRKVAFIMMRFGNTKAHTDILKGIQHTLDPFGITAVRADEKQYHDDLFPNVLTYIYGCGFGIAIFERIETEEFNPNVALEVGYMFALKKNVCLLKDRTLRTLQADLVGKLYRVFDPLDPIQTIPQELARWIKDKGLA
ncbi:MAG: hypothetical protein WCF57_03810 [Pyrinomonadaceae bacterium]